MEELERAEAERMDHPSAVGHRLCALQGDGKPGPDNLNGKQKLDFGLFFGGSYCFPLSFFWNFVSW